MYHCCEFRLDLHEMCLLVMCAVVVQASHLLFLYVFIFGALILMYAMVWMHIPQQFVQRWTELHVAIRNWFLIAVRVCVCASGDFLVSAGFERVNGRQKTQRIRYTFQFHGDEIHKTRTKYEFKQTLFDATLFHQFQMLNTICLDETFSIEKGQTV